MDDTPAAEPATTGQGSATPQIEVTFNIDVNGIVSVQAKDMATGKEQQITIQASGGLSDADIQRMVKVAEADAEADKKRREFVEAKNHADAMIHQVEKTLEENKDKISEVDKKEANLAVSDTQSAMKGNDAEAVKKVSERLSQAAMKIGPATLQWPTRDVLQKELETYSVHGPVLEQATAFLTHITTTVALYVTVTGAAWAVVSANTLGVSDTTLLWILGLHIALSLGVAIGLWGMGNNFIQRLNFARWLGVKGWPTIEKAGELKFAWSGVPANDLVTVKTSTEWINDKKKAGRREPDGWVRKLLSRVRTLKPRTSGTGTSGTGTSGTGTVREFGRNLRRGVQELDFYMRYRAFAWPSLRFQRFWALLPLGAACFSLALFFQVHGDGAMRKALCNQVAATLSFPNSTPIPRETFERARYLFDKAGCEIKRVAPRLFPDASHFL